MPDDLADRSTRLDSFATRPPSPESLEAMARAVEEAARNKDLAEGLSRQEFERSLAEFGFLDADGLKAYLEAMPPEARPIGTEALAKALVRDGKLTRYQAAALFQGKAKALLIGPYVVLEKLGAGGMGMVFKARLRSGGPEIALKLLPPSASKHPQAVLRFRREARIMEQLNHPNIVSSHEIGEFHGVHYLVMDYVDGRDLDRVIKLQGPMKVGRAVDYVIQAARGLHAAHERGIVHRDIKPANLLLDTNGVVRVLDLGLARIIQADKSSEDSGSGSGSGSGTSLTQSGIIMGTVDFLPPEQSDDSKRADHRADIYSLGCTLYFLLTGRPPYSGASIMQRLLAHHQKPVPALVGVKPEVTPDLEAIFQKMLAKTPEARPQSMADVIRALESARISQAEGRALRVFDDSGVTTSKLGAKIPARPLRKKPELGKEKEADTYDLMTFVRTELLEPSTDETEVLADPKPIPPARKPKKSQKLRSWPDLAIRWLVAAAAIVVLIRFFPKLPTRSEPSPAAIPEAVKPPVPPAQVVEGLKVKDEMPKTIVPTPLVEAPRADPPPDPGPPPPRSMLEELLGSPPRPGSQPPPPPPRGKRKDSKPPGPLPPM